MNKEKLTLKKLYTKDLSLNKQNTFDENGFSIRAFHLPEDPDSANRIRISTSKVEVELLLSKGLSVSQAWTNGQPVFWDAPINLPDTETLDLWSDEVCINGSPAPGFTFLKTLVGGIELYGLKNWGMPVQKDGKMELLHGETSNIPVDEVSFSMVAETCTVEASFVYRTFEGNSDLHWYERGEALFKVIKRIILTKDSLGFKQEDTIENISNRSLTPDWGYHITFRPEEGARYLVPSGHVQVRGGGQLPGDIETWHKAADQNVRTETGIIHRGLVKTRPFDEEETTSLLLYPDETGISVSTTPSPYFQTWFCCGGKGSKEFTFRSGESLLKNNWDGMGIEIGSSPLDHDGNIDKSVKYNPVLEPGEIREINIVISFPEGDELISLRKKIKEVTAGRK